MPKFPDAFTWLGRARKLRRLTRSEPTSPRHLSGMAPGIKRDIRFDGAETMLILLVVLFFCPTEVFADFNYVTLDFPGGLKTQAVANSGSIVVGTYLNGTTRHGFYYNAGVYTTLDPTGTTTSTTPTAISGTTVAGFFSDGSTTHGFEYSAGTYTILDAVDPSSVPASRTFATGISGTTVVGYYFEQGNASAQHGFSYDGRTYTTIDPPLSNDATTVKGVSGGGTVGFYDDAVSQQHGFLAGGSTITSIDGPNALATVASAISGTLVVGYYTDATTGDINGFEMNGSTMTLINPGSSVDSEAYAVSGQNVVGVYLNSSTNYSAFLYDGTSYTTLIPSAGATSVFATGVSGSDVVGYYRDSGGIFHGFLATPPGGTTQTFSAWASAYGIAADATGSGQNDGIPNLLKYIADIDPTHPISAANRAILPRVTFDGTTETLTYEQYSLATGVIVTAQSSPDLVTWTALSSSQTGTDGANLKMQAQTVPSGGKLFLRLDVTLQ